jgi:site-specific recombinase XerD
VTYASALRRFEEFLAKQRIDPAVATADALSTDVLERYLAWLLRAYGPERRFTLVTYIAGARAFFRYLIRRHLAPERFHFEEMRDNLREAMGRFQYKTPRVDRRLPLIVTYVNAQDVPSPAGRRGEKRREVLRDKALIKTLFCTGMRREEVARLNRADLEHGWATQAIITGKGEKERVVFFDQETLSAIRDYLAARADPYEPLFLRHDNRRGRPLKNGAGWRLSPQSIWGIVKRYSALVGVPATTHDFRHAKASVMLNRGAKLSEVQDILGHASPETTKRIYAHYEVAHLREAFDRFSASAEELARELRPMSDAEPRRRG